MGIHVVCRENKTAGPSVGLLKGPLLKLDMLYMALEAMDWMHRFLPMLRYSSPGLSFEFTRLPALESTPEAEPWRAQSQIGAVLLVP